jgi:hypothetical protein
MSDERRDYTEGLRQLADILDANPDLPLPYYGSKSSELLWIARRDEDHRAVARIFARAIPGTIAKNPRDTAIDLVGQIAGLYVQLIVDRDQVCERIVTGVEVVEMPASEAIPARPAQTIEREVVEWRCEPILAEATS